MSSNNNSNSNDKNSENKSSHVRNNNRDNSDCKIVNVVTIAAIKTHAITVMILVDI